MSVMDTLVTRKNSRVVDFAAITPSELLHTDLTTILAAPAWIARAKAGGHGLPWNVDPGDAHAAVPGGGRPPPPRPLHQRYGEL